MGYWVTEINKTWVVGLWNKTKQGLLGRGVMVRTVVETWGSNVGQILLQRNRRVTITCCQYREQERSLLFLKDLKIYNTNRQHK